MAEQSETQIERFSPRVHDVVLARHAMGTAVMDVRQHRRPLSLAVWTTATLLLALGVAGAWVLRGHRDLLSHLVSIVPFVVIGAFLVVRRPRNLVGWFVFGGGTAFALQAAATAYALLSVTSASSGQLRGGVAAAWAAEWLWNPGWVLVFLGIALVFPDGRLPSRRWRPVAWLAVLLPALQVLALALYPGPLRASGAIGTPLVEPGVLPDNPIGVPGAAGFFDLFDEAMQVAFVPLLLAAAIAQVVRYRRGTPTVRLQIRWLLVTVSTVLAGFLAATLLTAWEMFTGSPISWWETGSDWLFGLLVAGYPVAVAVAVLRYRLYEIDRFLNRTAVYAMVTVVLGAMYAGLVVGFQTLLRPHVGGRDLAVAGSTLAVAAAFGPVRRRAQRMVDRRFDRARYDAQRTVEAFAQRLRDEVDLAILTDELCGVVARTVRPAHVGVWSPEAADG